MARPVWRTRSARCSSMSCPWALVRLTQPPSWQDTRPHGAARQPTASLPSSLSGFDGLRPRCRDARVERWVAAVAAEMGAEPRDAGPSKNSTVPVGAPPPDETVAVNVTELGAVTGFRDERRETADGTLASC